MRKRIHLSRLVIDLGSCLSRAKAAKNDIVFIAEIVWRTNANFESRPQIHAALKKYHTHRICVIPKASCTLDLS